MHFPKNKKPKLCKKKYAPNKARKKKSFIEHSLIGFTSTKQIMIYDDIKQIGYRISPVLKDLSLEEDETITAVETFENNIYIGTSHGNLLHFHRFEDTSEYIFITKLEINPHPITKLLCVPFIQRLLVVSNRITFAFSLPELSPCHMKRMKDVNDMQLLSNSILVLSPSKIRIIKIQDDNIMVSKEINYSGAVTGNSCRDSHFIIVANNVNYDIIDLDNNRKVPLFAYKTETEVSPLIVSFDNEYLLTILSDASTSMAMFINSSGDVTRGTLTWVGQGYPGKGLAVESQYVFSAFDNKFVVSSLESLETVLETGNDLFSINRVAQVIVEDEEVKKLIDTNIQPVASQVVLNNGKEIYGVYKEHELVQLQQKLIDHEELKINADEFTGETYKYVIHMLLLSAIESNNEDTILELLSAEKYGHLVVHPEFVLHLFGDNRYNHKTFSGLQTLFDKLELSQKPDLMKKYIQDLKPELVTTKLKLYYYDVATENECLDFISKDNISKYNLDTKSIIELLTKKEKFATVSKLFKMLIDGKCTELLHDYSVFLVDGLLDVLLDDSIQLLQSGDLDDADYAKLIIGIIKFDKDTGYDILKKAPKKYQNINASILKDISGDSNNDKAFAVLQVAVVEKAYKENPALKNDLLELMINAIQLLYGGIKNQFDLLYKEFNEMNSLEKDKWPKIAWLDFLHICGKSKDLQQFIEIYLKTFELTLGSDTNLEGAIFNYYHLYQNRDINGLLEFGDYSTAEKFASGEDPLPRTRYFNLSQADIPNNSQQDLLHIFKFYLEQYSSGRPVESAIKHFTEQYSKFIPVLDLLSLIPASFPLAYLVEYFNATIVELNENYKDTLIRKSVSKAEALRTTKLCKNFSK